MIATASGTNVRKCGMLLVALLNCVKAKRVLQKLSVCRMDHNVAAIHVFMQVTADIVIH